MEYIIIVTPLLLAWLLDLIVGDPLWLPHPVVGFGRCISFCEKRLNRGSHRQLKGGFCAVVLITGVFALVWWILKLVSDILWLDLTLRTLLIFYCLAGTTLIREVRDVFKAVDISIEKGRIQVGRIVGRDTKNLTDQEIRTAALETLAENLSDGVVAPLFWFAILGLPGMMAYKMVNTLDSMIGYKNSRYKDFGMVAARIDDAANYLPARLTALLMLVCSAKPRLVPFVKRYGTCHASPNSGYPEAALAGLLDCRFGGTHDYFGESVYKPYIGETHRDFTYRDVTLAIAVNRKVEIAMVLLTLLTRLALR